MSVVVSGSNPKAVSANVRDTARAWVTAVNLHWAGVAVLSVVCLYLLVEMGLAWKLANSQNAEALAQQQIELKSAQIAARPLEGLDVKLGAANAEADKFYAERLPMSYSVLAGELGALKTKSNVRLSRVNYTQPAAANTVNGKKAADGPGGTVVPSTGKNQLTEVLMDASLTGDYRSLVKFINGLERDKVFFLINGITLTGQQTGQVSLRIRIATFLRGHVAADEVEKADAATSSTAADIDQMVDSRTKPVSAGGAR
jgi:hypothetical protein